jgi:hypothetical protein
VLVRLYDGDCLEGVSMVDGALVGGCSIYACGPEPVDRKGALRLAEELREEREERAERAEQEEQTDLLGEVVEYLNAKADHAEGRVPGSYADGMRNAAVDVGLWSAIRGRWRDGSTAAPGTDEG